MNAQKHLIPILIIIVVLVALISTYAWFASPTDTSYNAVVTAGIQTIVSFSNYNGTSEEYKYSGEVGYHLVDGSYVPYGNETQDAPYNWYRNFTYTAIANKNITVTLNLTKVVIDMPEYFSKSLDWVLRTAFSQDTPGYDAADYAKYFATTQETPATNDTGYYVVGTNENSLDKIVLLEEAANNYFYFRYWERKTAADDNEGNVTPGPIELTYDTEVTETGTTNTARIAIGYYGKALDLAPSHAQYGTYVAPFIFSATQFSGSEFVYTVMASAA